MRTTSRHDGKRPAMRLETLAGWIFADLLLVLMVVGLGSAVTKARTEPEVKPKEPEKVVLGMNQEPVYRTFRVKQAPLIGGNRGEIRRMQKLVADETLELKDNRAAMVFVWAGGSEPGAAIPVAKSVRDNLAQAQPGLFKGTVLRPYWDGQLGLGEVKLEIFLFQEGYRNKQ